MARYYSPSLGRFTSPDLPFADQHIGDPQSWNLYSYGRNNPVNGIDRDGYLWEELKNFLKWKHWVDDAHLESALKAEADRARGRLAAITGVTPSGKPISEYAKSSSNLEVLSAERDFANWVLSETLRTCRPDDVWAVRDEATGRYVEEKGRMCRVPVPFVGTVQPASWIRVGRWMSLEELTAMRTKGYAVESKNLGGSRVAYPPTPNAYKNAGAGDLYVEYDIPFGVGRVDEGSGWIIIPGPNSLEGRLANRQGRPVPQMPPVRDIKVIKQK